ncbi:recombination regulator RecX [Ligilactobacillus faecis]|uniref:recombination regulator RecX n=1 Tax=Ligilactobacillus faecis TaxID=762833 RepID=UPI00246997BD|nr:recombination regulator RecX [Ligilactobacillus faecis]WGN89724.1 recombination regulator RecX [Ligilactobacillus faecis]
MPKKITSIAVQKKAGRFNVFLDGHYAFPVSENTLIKYRLAKGMEISDNLIEVLKKEDQYQKAYSKALDHLSYQLRTVKEMKTYLKKLAIPEHDITRVIITLTEAKYLDDLNYAKSYVRTSAKTTDKGPVVITQKLRQKGVASDLIEEALLEFDFEQQVTNALKVAQKTVAKNHKLSFQALKNKLYQTLLAKGFPNQVIDGALAELELELDEEAEWDTLVAQGDKLWPRYRRLAEPKRSLKFKQALYRKGFSLSLIDEYLATLEFEE